MSTDLIFSNARIVTPEAVVTGTLRVENGRIVAVGEGGASPAGEDADGDYLIPGMIDLHTDHLERHVAPRPGVMWNNVSAAMAHDAQVATAGITTVFDSLSLMGENKAVPRGKLLRPMVDGLEAARRQDMLRADHFLHLRCEVGDPHVLDYLSVLVDDPAVRLLSIMDHTPGQRQYAQVEKWRQANRHRYSEAELDVVMKQRMASQEAHADRHRHAIAELAAARGLALASHDDETPAHVDEAVSLGVTISEFPTTPGAAQAARSHGLSILMGAPNVVRGGSHSGNVGAADLAAAGLLDILASDYVPISMLHAVCLLAEAPVGLGLPGAMALVSANPAKAAGLDDRGRIAPGLRADLVRFRLIDGVPHIRAVWRAGKRVA